VRRADRPLVSTSQLVAFSLTSLVIILVPGPSVLFTIARGIAWGRSVALLSVVGNSLGVLVLSAVVALGLGPVLTRSTVLTEAIEVAGGCYLLWLGVDALRHRRAHAEAMQGREDVRPSRATAVRQGFVVGLLNPKALVFFVAVFPHFVTPASGHVTLQLLTLGAVFAGIALVSDGAWGLGAGAARDRLLGAPRVLVWLRTAGGTVMLGLGALIIATALA
jgi:threonine/homoserine/homoserine lactone efflux protein